jgi:hypothetical protein
MHTIIGREPPEKRMIRIRCAIEIHFAWPAIDSELYCPANQERCDLRRLLRSVTTLQTCFDLSRDRLLGKQDQIR